MSWFKKKDPIPLEAKKARVEADLSNMQARKTLEDAKSMAQTLSEVRQRNHFAEAIRASMGRTT